MQINGVKKRILEESMKLFMKYGVKTITMNDIAKECGISKRTLYENFKDKDELLSLCLKTMNAYTQRERHMMQENSTDVVNYFMQTVNRLGERASQINPNFYRELNKFYPKIAKDQIEYTENTIFPEITHLIERGIAEGVFRQDIKIDLVARLLLGQFDYIANSDFAEKVKLPMSEILKTIIFQFVRGIATKKGITIINDFENREQNAFG